MRNPMSLRRLAAAFLALNIASCGGGGGDPGPAAPDLQDFGGTVLGRVARSGVAGTWGYTAPDGSRYALMGTAKGILVLDLRDGAAPRVVDEVDGPTNTSVPGLYWREMRVHGTHAYIVSEHTAPRGGVMILDLSGLPASVRFVKTFSPRDGELAAHTLDIDTARGLLYLQRATNHPAPHASAKGRLSAPDKQPQHPVGGPNDGSIEIWSLAADPENPTYVTTFNQHRSVHDMTAMGDYAYVAEGNASSYSIWDVRDPAAPALVTRWSASGNFAHNIWPSGDGSFVVTTEEYPNGLPARVWRLNGAAPPTLLSQFRVGQGTPHNVVMEGRMAYLSHYTEGGVAVDLSDPASPRVVARVDTTPAIGPALAGCWGVYKFPGLPWMACSNISRGFHLIQLAP
jgi:choice-of-anchor B domain-containing protein